MPQLWCNKLKGHFFLESLLVKGEHKFTKDATICLSTGNFTDYCINLGAQISSLYICSFFSTTDIISMFSCNNKLNQNQTTGPRKTSDEMISEGHEDESAFRDITGQTVGVPANSVCPVSISANMQPAAHMSMALV